MSLSLWRHVMTILAPTAGAQRIPGPTIGIALGLLISLLGCRSGGQQVKPAGLRLLEVHGCIGCHSVDGSKRIGPSLKGVCGSEVVVKTNGVKRTITVDRAYLRRSILDPQADVVDGFEPSMPTNFKTQLGDNKLDTILDYLDSIKDDRSKSCLPESDALIPSANPR